MGEPADDITIDGAFGAAADTAPGGTIGRFVVLGSLGAGGMGIVLSAYDPVLDRKVALKLLRSDAWSAGSEQARTRLAHEAKAMARLSHPNVVTIYEIGTVGEQPFVAMELVDGPTLKRWLHEQPRTPAHIACMFIAAGRGLEAAHQAGLVHRDFKPDNVLVGRDNRPRVSDFGLARLRPAPERVSHGAPLVTTIAGTRAYMSPEQVRGEIIDARSDQYSFCVALHEALYGERPFIGDDGLPRDPPEQPPTGGHDERAWMYAPVRRGLMVRPEDRWPSMNALLEALSRDQGSELPAPGEPWRAMDPASHDHRGHPQLDTAVRRIGPRDAHTPREPCLKPSLVGRAGVRTALQRAAYEAQRGGVRVVLLVGPLGIGRTRLLEVAVEEAGVSAERVLQAGCSPERRSPLKPLLRAFEALPDPGNGALGLLQDAIERALMPALLPGAQRGNEALEGIEDALLWAAADAPVVLALDDIQWADAQTLGLVSLLVERAELGAKARLFVVMTARDEPDPFPPFRALLGKIRSKVRAAAKHLALGPLTPAETAALAQAVCPLDPQLEQVVVRGSGGVPSLVLHALVAWREQGAIAWRDGAWHAVGDRVLQEVPGVADLIEDRLASYFELNSATFHAALAALAAVALYGGGLGIETLLRIGGEHASVERALEALAGMGMLVVSGERQEYSFAQEMSRQAALSLLRRKPWFRRLHITLLDVIAAGPSVEADADFLATGYEKLGFREKACVWLGRAMDSAIAAGRFPEAAAFGHRLAKLTADPEARLDVELAVVRVFARGRQFEEAKEHLAHIEAREAVLPTAGSRAREQDLRRRIRKLEVARGLSEAAADPTLLAEADALGDPVLRCEARMALAGVAPQGRALDLAGEAVALSQPCGPAIKFAARVLRAELCYVAGRQALPQAERDLREALSIAVATSSTWQQVHIEGDLAVLEGELGRLGAAIERLSRLAEQAEARGMRGQLRLLCNNLAIGLMRDGRAKAAAEMAKRTADLATEAGDPTLRAVALSLQAYALRHTGDLDTAVASADEADRLQRARDERRRAQTLIRRAEILHALGRADEAMADARAARDIAQQRGDRWSFVTANLWERFHLAMQGEATREEVARALAEIEAAGVGKRIQTQNLVEQAATWLRSSAEPKR